MQALVNYGITELSFNEQVEVEGGGCLSDAIAAVVHYVKCDCNKPAAQYHEIMRNSNYGAIR